jgi:hypothetical protein
MEYIDIRPEFKQLPSESDIYKVMEDIQLLKGGIENVPPSTTIEDLALIADPRYKGWFIDLTALQTAYPTAVAGDFATVGSGVGVDPVIYAWDNIEMQWEITGGSGTVISVFGRTAAVVAQTGDYTWNQINKTISNLNDITTKNHSSLTLDGGTNPHGTTKSDVGLSAVTNDAQLKRAAGDLNSFTEKTATDLNDIVIIEDSADTYNKKKVKINNIINTNPLVVSDIVQTLSGVITRTLGKISSITKTGGRTINLTRDIYGYIASVNDGTRTWTYTRDVNNQIISWSVT